ncbi:MAG: TIGR00270 family protein [Candidatus Altiarchaeales archaeon ex4484_2]|nr:MAG: TIGR00270 family protein [Candidatus Altiarchaeales archaeon ex4484_2]
MECELCGRSMIEGRKVKVEGSIVTVCDQCSEYGEVVKPVPVILDKPRKPEKKRRYDFSLNIQEELIEDYGIEVKKARERKNMKQEELAKKINEPASMVKKIESGKMKPSIKIAKRVEGILGIKLIEKIGEKEIDKSDSGERKEITLGDVITIRKKKRG